MFRKLRSRINYANVVATLALFVAVGTGTAYAANTVFSTDIVDGEVKSVDVGDNEIKSSDVKDESLTTFDVSTFLGADVVDGSLTGADISDNTIGVNDIGSQQVASDEVLNDSLLQSDIRAGAVTGDEVLDDSLTSDDIQQGAIFSIDIRDGGLISADIQNGSLTGADIADTGSLSDLDLGRLVARNVPINIGTVNGISCVNRAYTTLGEAVHLILTPSLDDAHGGLMYDSRWSSANGGTVYVHVCNFGSVAVDDGITHFSVLGIAAF